MNRLTRILLPILFLAIVATAFFAGPARAQSTAVPACYTAASQSLVVCPSPGVTTSPASITACFSNVQTVIPCPVPGVTNPPVPPPTSPPGPGGGVAVPNGMACAQLSPLYNTIDLPACWRPFLDSSGWNTKLPASPAVNTALDPAVRYLATLGGANPNTMNTGRKTIPYDTNFDFTSPYYFSSPLDPLITITCYEPYGTCALQGNSYRIPVGARPEGSLGGGDSHMVVVDPVSGVEIDMYEVPKTMPASGGTLSIGFGEVTNIYTGTGWDPGGGATAGGGSPLAGQYRTSELVAGHIDHALAMSTYCNTNSTSTPPATGNATGPCPAPTGGATPGPTIQLGKRLWLDLTPGQIDALSVSRATKIVMKALNQYGGYVVDTNGSNASFGLQGEPTSVMAYALGVPDWTTLYAQIAYPAFPYPPQGEAQYQLDISHATDWGAHLHVLQ